LLIKVLDWRKFSNNFVHGQNIIEFFCSNVFDCCFCTVCRGRKLLPKF